MSILYLGPENQLSPADGELIQDTRNKIDRAIDYLDNFYLTFKDSPNETAWNVWIDGVKAKLKKAQKAFDPSKIFPGNSDLATYKSAAEAYHDLWLKATFSPDQIPEASIADAFKKVFQIPGDIAAGSIDGITEKLSESFGIILKNLWPYIIVAGVGFGVYMAYKLGLLKKLLGKGK